MGIRMQYEVKRLAHNKWLVVNTITKAIQSFWNRYSAAARVVSDLNNKYGGYYEV